MEGLFKHKVYQYQIRKISIEQINLKDRKYCISSKKDLNDLKESIKLTGLINLPVIQVLDNNDYRVISGFQRVKACIELNYKSLECKIIDKDLSDFKCAIIAITDNINRPLDLLEQSKACHLIIDTLPEKESIGNIAPKLGLPENPKMFKKMSELCQFPKKIQDIISDGTISLAMAYELVSLPLEESMIYADFFSKLKLSLSKQREIINWAGEISKRDDILLSDILNCSYIKTIFEDEKMEGNKKASEIRNYLKQQRYPMISKFETDFKRKISRLPLKKGMKLIPPVNFESQDFNFELRFRSSEELQKQCEILTMISRSSDFEKIFYI